MKKHSLILILTLILPLLILFGSCKKYNLERIQHRWQFIEIPLDSTIEIWSFDTDGRVHLIRPNGTSEDTAATGNYDILYGGRVRIAGFAASYNATWEIAKNNLEVMVLSTKDMGGMTTVEFLNLDAE